MAEDQENAELFIGIVARIGVDTRRAAEMIQEALEEYRYNVTEVKLTLGITEIEKYSKFAKLKTEERYKHLIEACNEVRQTTELPDVMARFAIRQISTLRPSEDDAGERLEGKARFLRRNAYVINQLKRKEEMKLLRSTYGDHYVQISFHADAGPREQLLADKIAHDHSEKPRWENWRTKARELMDDDDAQEGIVFGQRVRDVFPLSDVVIDATTPKSMKEGLERFFRALFGDNRVTPTRDEYGMQLAVTASLRSSDLSRQVGAAILNQTAEVQALGSNEVPKAGGGTYWEGDPSDAREFQLEKDSNDERKKEILLDLAARMAKAGLIADEYLKGSKLQDALIDRTDTEISDSQLMDSLEYGRTVHAEMNAITDAARNGHAVRDCTLYCNTFPCHNCAKHIVASGISLVRYLLPYPKSYASQLFSDSIIIDEPNELKGKIRFNQYIGIVGPIFNRIFTKSRWKEDDGTVKPFVKKAAKLFKGPIKAYYSIDEADVGLELTDLLAKHSLNPMTPAKLDPRTC